MKKIITLVLSGALMLSALPAEAAKAPSLNFMKTSINDSKYYNVEQNGKMSFKLNEEILALDLLDELMDDKTSPIDIVRLVESLFDSEITYTAKQKTTNAGEKSSIQIDMKSNLPIKFNKNLELDVNQTYSYWMDMDFSKEDSFDMNMIASMPMNKRYITMDMSDMEDRMSDEELEEYNQVMKKISDLYDSDEELSQIQDKMIESIYANAKVTGSARDIKISFTDLGLKKWFADIFEMSLDLYPEETKAELMEQSQDMLDSIKDAAINVPFFADDALVMKYKLDSKDRVISENVELNVDINLYDLISYFEEETGEITKENSNISFSVLTDSQYKYSAVSIKKPELTQENSVSVSELVETSVPQDDIVYEDMEEFYTSYVSIDVDENFYGKNGGKYIPVRALLEEFEYNVSYDNGIITAISDSKYADYDKIILDVKSNNVKADEISHTISSAPVIINDKSYIKLEDAEIILKFKIEHYGYYIEEKWGYVDGYRNSQEEDFEEN